MNPTGSLGKLLTWYVQEARTLLARNIDRSRRFPLDMPLCMPLQRMLPDERQAALRRLFTELPVPLLRNITGQAWAFGGEAIADEVAFFVGALANQMYRVWAGRDAEWQCPVYETCKLAIRNDECRTRPWRKGLLEASCSYGNVAKVLRLADRHFRVPSA
jgi:hypothetical protein